MKIVQVAAAALNQTPLDWDGNLAHILAALEGARAQGASVCLLPELAITGYGCEDAFYGEGTSRMAEEILFQEILPHTQGLVVAVGLPVHHRNALFNCACLIADGRVLGFAAKRYLAGDGVHYEHRWFKPWPEAMFGEVEIGGGRYPIGDLCFEVGGVRFGFEICEDAWVASRPGISLSRRGVDVILNPSASHFAFDKVDVRRRFVIEGSRAFGVSYVYANLLGNEAGRILYDGGALVASGGRMVAEGPRFSFRDVEVTTAAVDVEATRMAQARTASYTPSLREDDGVWVRFPEFVFPEVAPAFAAPSLPAWELEGRRKEEEFARAVALGLFDYLRKSRSQGFVVSLSGGADSAAVASLIRLLVELGLAQLGAEGFRAKLAHIPGLEGRERPEALVERLLTTVYQATRNSSTVTREAARLLAGAIGARHYEFDVDALVEGYRHMVEGALGRSLAWETDDMPLQNIQARTRAPGVWMVANVEGKLLLATSNRSEAAVGYATMDGDTAGGYSPISGIDKMFLRRWLAWLEKEGPEGLGSIPALSHVNRQQPTAELRPGEAGQTDEEDLMPYPVLDAIEQAAIRDQKRPVDVFRILRSRFPEPTEADLFQWIERFFRLWCRNQWKRERYAPSLHLDDRNLDPRSWLRFPILSGGYRREMEELRTYLERRTG